MNKKGAALILTYIVIAVLTILGIALLSSSISEINNSRRFTGSTRAFWLAEAGLQRGIWEIKYGAGAWTGWNLDAGTGDRVYPPTQIQGAITGEYDIRVTNPAGNSHTLTASGYYPDHTTAVNFVRTVTVQLSQEHPFMYGAFGQQSISLNGNAFIDSYDSALGAYDVNGNKGSNVDVGTNGTTEGAVTLTGNAKVYGDAGTGPGGTIVKTGSAAVTGDETHDNDVDLPANTVPSALSSLADEGALTINGNNSATLSGTHKYTSISVSGNGILTISDTAVLYLTGSSSLSITGNGKLISPAGSSKTVTLYIDGNAQISGNGVVNQSSLPQNFLIYGTGTPASRSIQISGNGDFYGAIYSPDADIDVTGNGSIYGAAVGNTVDVSGNGNFHYDEALQQVVTSSGFRTDNWQEI